MVPRSFEGRIASGWPDLQLSGSPAVKLAPNPGFGRRTLSARSLQAVSQSSRKLNAHVRISTPPPLTFSPSRHSFSPHPLSCPLLSLSSPSLFCSPSLFYSLSPLLFFSLLFSPLLCVQTTPRGQRWPFITRRRTQLTIRSITWGPSGIPPYFMKFPEYFPQMWKSQRRFFGLGNSPLC